MKAGPEGILDVSNFLASGFLPRGSSGHDVP